MTDADNLRSHWNRNPIVAPGVYDGLIGTKEPLALGSGDDAPVRPTDNRSSVRR